MKIGIFGSTGLIAVELKNELERLGHHVVRFSRNPNKEIGLSSYNSLPEIEDLSLIVNLAGDHQKNRNETSHPGLYDLDKLGCEWSSKTGRPYVFVSSGSVFGISSIGPVSQFSSYADYGLSDAYTRTKLDLERRHLGLRVNGDMVSDIRIFSYAGPFFIKNGNYFLSELFSASKDDRKIKVAGSDFLRDYIGARELAQAVMSLGGGSEPISYNLSSLRPASKQEILDVFRIQLGLLYEWKSSTPRQGKAVDYYCAEFSDQLRGYHPRESIEVIRGALKALLH
jgi:nucleoside-diphosphate-sugar epimerase